ncbi:MAG: hypothetical protein FDW93_03935 [Bergeyella sp.]|nr:hypothetical protein [Bergeyella sp.]
MKLTTPVDISPSEILVGPEDRIFSIGSCFAQELARILSLGELQVLSNPYGTLFSPCAIERALRRIRNADLYTEKDLIIYENYYISLDHHSSFDSPYLANTLENINAKIENSHSFLRGTQWVIITLGTSWIYEFLPQGRGVSNCRKIPQRFFSRRLLGAEEIYLALENSILHIQAICPENVQLLFTVSPVRHSKEGMIENQRSKSLLISVLHEVIEPLQYCHYIPVYEIMMDELRGYRFYKEDMIHPSTQSISYIFEKFSKAYFSEDTDEFVKENLKIHQAFSHKPKDKNDFAHQAFLDKIQRRIKVQQQKVKHKIFL